MRGMAAQIPIKNNPAANQAALDKVRADKEREARDGHDGTWVAHPGLVQTALEAFAGQMKGPNQLHRLHDVKVTAAQLLEPLRGPITEQGVRWNLHVGVRYLEAWLMGSGAEPIHNLMEDLATSEISRSQLWQWLRFGAKLDDGRAISGELYDRRKVDDLREAMVSTRLFRTVSAEPVLTGETAEDGTQYVNVLVRQDAGPARSLDATAGYSTGEGFRIEAAWEHRNLFRPEGALRIAAIAGTAEQNLSVRFRRNNWGQRDRALLLQFDIGARDFEAFQGYTTRLYGLISRESTPIWQKRWTYAYGAEILATNENRNGTARISLSDAYFIGGLIGQLGYDRSNSLLDPTSGFRLLARVNPEASLRNGADFYIRNLIEGSVYYPVGENLTLAGRVRFGSIFGIPRDQIAPSRRLYAGGGGSVRGYGFQELGPRDINNVPLGGRSLSEFAVEGRYRFGNYGVVAFVDAGQVSEAQYPDFSGMRFGVGVGGRVYTNFGPVRVDVATPIGRRQGEALITIYVSIGQAF